MNTQRPQTRNSRKFTVRSPQEVEETLDAYLARYRAMKRPADRKRLQIIITTTLVNYINLVHLKYIPKYLKAIKEVDPDFPLPDEYVCLYERTQAQAPEPEPVQAPAQAQEPETKEEEEYDTVAVVSDADEDECEKMFHSGKKRKTHHHVFGFPGRGDDEVPSQTISAFLNVDLADSMIGLYESIAQLSQATGTLVLPASTQLALDYSMRAGLQELSPSTNVDTEAVLHDLEFAMRMIRTMTENVRDITRNLTHK